MDDSEIISQLFAREERALSVLKSHMGHRLQRTARNILPTDADAEECVNDTYLAIWNSIPPKRPQPLSAYILRLCKNIAISRLRRLTAQKRSSYDMALDELQEAIGVDSLEQALSARELGQAIDRFLDTLSRESRVIFLRRHWYGDSVADIAKNLGLSESNVSVRLHRTRQKLKTYLIQEGYYE